MSTHSLRLIAFLYVAQALFLASTFRSWLPVGLATALACVIAVGRGRGRHGDGHTSPGMPTWLRASLITIAVIAIILLTGAWRLGKQAGDLVSPVLVGVETVAHASLFVSLFVWTLRPRRGHVSMLGLGMMSVLLCVAAGGVSRSAASQTTVGLTICLGFTIASQLILGVARETDAATQRWGDEKAAWIGPLVSLLALTILMMATSAIASATNLVLPGLQTQVQKQLEASMDAVVDDSRFGGTGYVRGTKLGVIREHMLGFPKEIALRVVADRRPGYLRGHAMDLYREGRWGSVGSSDYLPEDPMAVISDREVGASGAGTVPLRDSTAARLRRFPLADAATGRSVNLEIHNAPMKGQMVFLPLATQWIEARGTELILSQHGIVRFGVDVSLPYVAGVGPVSPRETLPTARRIVLLRVPPSVSAQTESLAEEICGSLSTTKEKAEAISRFFQTRFTYSLDRTRPPSGVDPIVHFLRTRHPAHCEYFGSATVLLLRSAGVPARYVTGYVAGEYYDEDSVWLARNRDAHAWAEAYDPKNERWFPVESTPGRVYQTVVPDAQTEAGSGVFNVFGSSSDEEGDTVFESVAAWLMSFRISGPMMTVFRFIQLPLFCVLTFLLWTRYLRAGPSSSDPIDQQSLRMLRKVDRRMRRRALVRQPGETLHQFADRIDAAQRSTPAAKDRNDSTWMCDISNWYRDYANARYQGKMPQRFS